MVLTPVEAVRHGGKRSLVVPRPLAGGRFTLGLDTPSVRSVAIDGTEVAQTITFTVRDRTWTTIEANDWSTSTTEGSEFTRVDMEGHFTSEEIDLFATVTVQIGPNGALTYAVKATALQDFERSRIGICLMHPATLSGQRIHVTTPTGTYSTAFPSDISASRSITDIVKLRHGTESSGDITFEFEGDLFEFEDQRNWADASYKTFCTPLGLPRPVAVRSGDVIEQSLRISAVPDAKPRRPPPTSALDPVVRIDLDASGTSVPSIGVLSDLDPEAIRAVRDLGVSHVRVTVDADSDTAPADLGEVANTLDGSDVNVELEIVSKAPANVARLHDAVEQLQSRLRHVFVFDREMQITPRAYVPAIESLRSLVGPRVGGGSGSSFGRINFHLDEIDLDALDVLTFPMSPQAHYTDHFSFLTNLDAQAVVAENGRRMAGTRSLSIGPITLLPRQPGEPPAPDARSESLLAAAWTLASFRELAASSADALTYHTVGPPGGIVTAGGDLTPIYHVLADLGRYSAGQSLPVDLGRQTGRIAAVCLRRPTNALVVIANLTTEQTDIDLRLSSPSATVRTLDETTYKLARSDRKALIDSATEWNGGRLRLAPFAISTLEVQI